MTAGSQQADTQSYRWGPTNSPRPPFAAPSQATAADILLPLMVGAAFLFPPAMTQATITLTVVLQMCLTWWIGIKLQKILLHMAMRYQTRIRKDAVRQK